MRRFLKRLFLFAAFPAVVWQLLLFLFLTVVILMSPCFVFVFLTAFILMSPCFVMVQFFILKNLFILSVCLL